jgi:transposase
MKKEARLQAEKIFLRAGGKVTNREIAKAVKVNALTIGRWKRDYQWDRRLKGEKHDDSRDFGGIVRKKAARDTALKIYMEADGNITNKELAKRVGVSPATISKWKEVDNWIGSLAPMQDYNGAGKDKDLVFDIGELASPQQIVEINRRIDSLLQRDHLSASEIADIAEAKSDLLGAVEIYLTIVRDIGAIQIES